MSWFKLGSKQSKVRSDETITDQKLDGKDQPIDQYKLTSKKAGKKTKEIKQDWNNSITIAHTMLVEVNQELSKILKELDEISARLDKIRNPQELLNAKKKFNAVREPMSHATYSAIRIENDFKKDVCGNLRLAADRISKVTAEDFSVLEKGMGLGTFNRIKEMFERIKLLDRNINANPQDTNQAAEPSKKKHSNAVDGDQTSYADSEGSDSSSEDEGIIDNITSTKKKVSIKKKVPIKEKGSPEKKPSTEYKSSAVKKDSPETKTSGKEPQPVGPGRDDEEGSED
jgi:hypothetical protein